MLGQFLPTRVLRSALLRRRSFAFNSTRNLPADIGIGQFSTRPRGGHGGGRWSSESSDGRMHRRGEFQAGRFSDRGGGAGGPKSLIEDEADLSDMVRGIDTRSLGLGLGSESDDDSEPESGRGPSRRGGRDGVMPSRRGRDGNFGSRRGRDDDFGSRRGRDGDFGSRRGRDGDFGSRRGRDGDFGSKRGRDGDFGSRRGRDGDFGSRRGRDGDFGPRRGRDGDFDGDVGSRKGRDGNFDSRNGRDIDFGSRRGRGGHFDSRRGRGGHFDSRRGRDDNFDDYDQKSLRSSQSKKNSRQLFSDSDLDDDSDDGLGNKGFSTVRGGGLDDSNRKSFHKSSTKFVSDDDIDDDEDDVHEGKVFSRKRPNDLRLRDDISSKGGGLKFGSGSERDNGDLKRRNHGPEKRARLVMESGNDDEDDSDDLSENDDEEGDDDLSENDDKNVDDLSDSVENDEGDMDDHIKLFESDASEVKSETTVKKVTRTPKTNSSGESGSYLSETRFDQCSISSLSLKGIKDAGYEKMTLVQEATLPIILKGKDVLAKAKTGTGKTVAFLLPAIEVVAKVPPPDRDNKRPPIIVLIVCPTRELATQASNEANKLLKFHPSIGVQVVIGGVRLAIEQKRMQSNPCQILVATPGRLKDHTQNTPGFASRLTGVKVLVLDEADHLLDMGFRRDIETIIAAVPKQRQTLLFSATVPQEVQQIGLVALKRDYEFINTVQEGSEETHAQVKQLHLVAPLEKHFALLYSILKEHIGEEADFKVLVFCTTAMVTGLVSELLAELKLNVRQIHSRKPQSYRTRVSDEFRRSKGLILVTSDVSARGVDYPDVTLVIQVGVPSEREQYIHRLGRTGRKGKEGKGLLLLAPWEEYFLSSIKDLPIKKATAPSIDPDLIKKVDRALSQLQMKNKESAYQAWLGYYNSNKNIGRDKVRLVQLANEFSRCMGMDNPPAIPKVIIGKMGLKNVPGLRFK